MTSIFCIMVRRKKPVEGAILDLTGVEPVVVAVEVVEKKPEVTDEQIIDVIKGFRRRCNRCERDVYATRVWEGGRVCVECYNVVYPAHKEALEAWICEEGPKECEFCGKVRGNPSEFHYDHINMFDKTGTVGRMLFDGVAIDRIKEEIQKCQLLCLDCHVIVTKMEHHLGFIYAKTYKRKRVDGCSRDEYDAIMGRVYEIIKQIKRGGT